MTPSDLSSYLVSSEDGYLDSWAEISEYVMETDPHIASTLQTAVANIVSTPWKVIPGRSYDGLAGDAAVKAAKFVQGVFLEMVNFEASLASIMSAISPGTSAHRLIWTRKHGAYVITDLEWVHTRRFRWDKEYVLRLWDKGATTGEDGYGEHLIKNLWVIHTSQERPSYPTRAGLVREIAWPWLFKRWTTRYYMHSMEKYGQPMVYATVPGNATSDVRNEVQSALENLSYDHAAAFEEGVNIVFDGGPSVGGDGSVFLKFLEYANAEISKAVLGAADIVDPGTHGSQSAVDTRAEATLDPRTSTRARALAATMREQVIKPLILLNLDLFGGRIPPMPRLVFSGMGQEDEDTTAPDIGTQPAQQPDVQDTDTQPTGDPIKQVEQEAVDEGTAVSPNTALNGAQVTALLEIVAKVADGLLPRQTGIETMIAAFPIDRQTAERIMGEVGKSFTPKVEGEPPQPQQAMTIQASVPKAQAPKRGATDSSTGENQMMQVSLPLMSPIKKALSSE
jgi:phage gp29-like protein